MHIQPLRTDEIRRKLNEPGRQKLGRYADTACKAVYSGLLQAQKTGTFHSPGLPPGGKGSGLNVCIRAIPHREDYTRKKTGGKIV